jgi:MinD-like ATPase involved in chromosome partitioning or flagellar assembly
MDCGAGVSESSAVLLVVSIEGVVVVSVVS